MTRIIAGWHGLVQRSPLSIATCASLLALCAVPSSACSQVVRQVADPGIRAGMVVVDGFVRDGADRGIVGAEILIGASRSVVSDEHGAFHLGEMAADTIRLVVRRIGFDSVSLSLPLLHSGIRTELIIAMRRTHSLAVITVEGKAYDQFLWDKGFYRRQKTASGSFFDPDFLEHFGGSGLGSVLREAQRVDVRRINNQEYAFSAVGGSPCRMNVFIDGIFQRLAMPSPTGAQEGMGLGELIGFRDVHAVEVYPRANFVPTQFVRMGPAAGPAGRSTPRLPSPNGMKSAAGMQGDNQDAACGAIVIWTRPVNETPSPNAPAP